ncbi:MAG: hypothetical protein Q4A11_00910 [Brachymonas sp.]|nr:hypothetical protein [Brachymonas sp.]
MAASLFSGFFSGLFGGIIASYYSDKKIKIENITSERAKWRERMRDLAKDLVRLSQCYEKNRKEQMASLCAELEARLNPVDKENRDLLASARALIPARFKLRSYGLEGKINEFNKRMALLLKHDWECEKYEASFWSVGWFKRRRVGYCEYISGNELYENNFQYFAKNKGALLKCMMYMLISGVPLFAFSYILVVEFKDLFVYLIENFDRTTVPQWVDSIGLSISAGLLWVPTYLFFKTSDNKFLEIWSSRPVKR